MEKDPLEKIFSDFRPDTGDKDMFMSRLMRNLDTVEIVKRQNSEYVRNSRKAMWLSAVAGFITGVISCLLMPEICTFVTSLHLYGNREIILSVNYEILAWLMVGAASVFMAVNCYFISLPLLMRHKNS